MCKRLKKLLRKVVNVCGVTIVFLICSHLIAHAETQSINISVDANVIYSIEDTITARIEYSNREMYNEHVYLAYHVKSENGDILRYESERYSLSLDDNNVAVVPVKVNISDVETENGVFLLELDIVDEDAMIWLSDANNIDFHTSVVRCETKGINRVFGLLGKEINNAPIIFSINLIVFIVFVGSLVAWKKSNANH